MITKEKLEHHIAHLQHVHDELDKQIQDLYEHHADDLKVEELKKKKLHLRDEIEAHKKQIENL